MAIGRATSKVLDVKSTKGAAATPSPGFVTSPFGGAAPGEPGKWQRWRAREGKGAGVTALAQVGDQAVEDEKKKGKTKKQLVSVVQMDG